MSGHVTESIFDGATHIIPLADVSHCQRIPADTQTVFGRKDPAHPQLRVWLKGATAMSPPIFLEGDEMEAFTRDWCRYRHELEKDTLYPLHTIETVQMGDMKHEVIRPALSVSDDMVSRFLSWRLPTDFHPDCGIRFAPLNHPNSWPIGTNLFTANQAKAMLEHVLQGSPTTKPVLSPDDLREGDVLLYIDETCDTYTNGREYVFQRLGIGDYPYVLSDDGKGPHHWSREALQANFHFVRRASPEAESGDRRPHPPTHQGSTGAPE